MRTQEELEAELFHVMKGTFGWVELRQVLLLQTEILLDIRTILVRANPDEMMGKVRETMKQLEDMRSS